MKSNQGMRDLSECVVSRCFAKGTKRACCRMRYCDRHAEFNERLQWSERDILGHCHHHNTLRYSDCGWMPGAPVVLGPFEGMPVKKSLKLRKLAAKAPAKRRTTRVGCPNCGWNRNVDYSQAPDLQSVAA